MASSLAHRMLQSIQETHRKLEAHVERGSPTQRELQRLQLLKAQIAEWAHIVEAVEAFPQLAQYRSANDQNFSAATSWKKKYHGLKKRVEQIERSNQEAVATVERLQAAAFDEIAKRVDSDSVDSSADTVSAVEYANQFGLFKRQQTKIDDMQKAIDSAVNTQTIAAAQHKEELENLRRQHEGELTQLNADKEGFIRDVQERCSRLTAQNASLMNLNEDLKRETDRASVSEKRALAHLEIMRSQAQALMQQPITPRTPRLKQGKR